MLFSLVALILGVSALVFRVRLAHFFTYSNPFNPFKPRFVIPPAAVVAVGVGALLLGLGGLAIGLVLR